MPGRPAHPDARALKPWARAVVTTWVLTVVPVLLGVAVLMILTLPRVVGTAWAAAGAQQDQMAAAWGDGDLISVAARALAMVVVVLPIAAFAYVLVRLVRQVGGAVLRRTAGKPLQRGLGGPHDPGPRRRTRARLVAVGGALPPDPGVRARARSEASCPPPRPVPPCRSATRAPAPSCCPNDTALPDARGRRSSPPSSSRPTGLGSAPTDDTDLAAQTDESRRPDDPAVRRPVRRRPRTVGPRRPTSSWTPGDDTWIFPFDEPLAPGGG